MPVLTAGKVCQSFSIRHLRLSVIHPIFALYLLTGLPLRQIPGQTGNFYIEKISVDEKFYYKIAAGIFI